jgi:hypothetical protein
VTAREKPALISIDLESAVILSEKSWSMNFNLYELSAYFYPRLAKVYAPNLLTVHSHDLNGAMRASCDCGRNATQ